MRVPRLVVAGRLLCLVLVLASGCKDANDPPSTGTVRVSLTTTGDDIDPDGYVVRLDGVPTRTVRANGAVTISGVEPGTRAVRLEGLAANCAADGGAERTLTVAAGREVTAAFAVSCARLSSIAVSIATTGGDVDVSGYYVNVDGGTAQRVGASGTLTIGGLAAGEHTVTLYGVAANCALAVENPQTVSVAAGETAVVRFTVTCVARVGSLRVTTVTTGSDIDLDGYTVEVMTRDYYYPEVIAIEEVGANASVTFPTLPAGSYEVILAGVASNCTVAQPPPWPSITVMLGATVDLTFTIQCLGSGSLKVTNVTSGPDPDPNGYTVRIQGARYSGSVSLATGGTVTIPGLPAGSYSAVIDAVAENCARSGPDTARVEVVAQATATLALDVACTPVTRLAFVSERDGNPEIYAVNSNGTGATRLTTNAARDLDPAWSPDGRRIAFTSDRSGTPEIWLMDADGSNLVRRTSAGASSSHPAWSPDGRRIAFVSTRDGNLEIYVMGADDGSSPVRLTNNRDYDSDPAWSPDGARIAFTSDRNGPLDVYVMNADGSGVARLTRNTPGGSWSSRPAWSPDGRKIAAVWTAHCSYYCYYDDEYDRSIQLMNADGSGAKSLPLVPALDDAALAWSPDGRTLAFSAQACGDGSCRISVVYARVDGGSGDLIVSNGYSPSWRR